MGPRVDDELLNQRNHRQYRRDVTVYPLKYSKDLVDFDNWDFFFMKSCCQSLTMHQFKGTPPKRVLDVACGSGLWILEAAKEWKDCNFTGFDYLKDIRPKLHVLPKAIAQRVEWIHGSFLEPLPFPSNHFDMVRSVRIALHLPQNECQDLMNEIFRVLSPGGVYEIIEEDLIFPHSSISLSCGDTDVDDINKDFRLLSSDARSLSPYNSFTGSVSQLSLDNRSLYSNGASCRSPTFGSNFSTRSWGRKSSQPDLMSFQLSAEQFLPSLEFSEHKHLTDPRDHSRLKEAWDKMVRKRGLTPRATTFLPTYLPISFSNVMAPQTLQIPLPPNSSAQRDDDYYNLASTPSGREQFDVDIFSEAASRSSGATTQVNESLSTPKLLKSANSSWVSMHLARTVHTVIGCKEAIWDAYQDLFCKKLTSPPVIKSSRAKDLKHADNSRGLRDRFESDWRCWESDMRDRIGIRGCIGNELMWAEPPGQSPDWRVWRDSLEMQHDDDESTLCEDVDLCRSIRGFVCWKPGLAA